MFMSPVVASLLAVPDPATFVTTFVTFYTGLVPMLATAGNTTDDGFVGAIVNDCFADSDDEAAAAAAEPERTGDSVLDPYSAPVRLLGIVISAAGLWMVVAPQARMGLPALRWMSQSAFQGEAVVGALVLFVGLWMWLGRRESMSATAGANA